MAKSIMIQGTCSGAGKSMIVAGLCRIFQQDGYKVAPFKSQNMALNSYITKDGLEMGRAQVVQAEASKVEPSVFMNPILLKPTGDTKSQVIVNGEILKNMTAKEYYQNKKILVPEIQKAYDKLDEEYDIIVIEGAGSPAEINLKENDIVNMFMAKLVDAPVLLTGDIDRGGVFAALYGTVALFDDDEKERVKGLLINKFRGDISILQPGLDQIQDITGIKVVGTIPYLDVDIDDEDSLSEKLDYKNCIAPIEIAVIKTPRISNFTDLNVFEYMEQVSVKYVDRKENLGNPDMIVLPGSKNTIDDLIWMRESGLEALIKKKVEKGVPIFGICGGYQMLGQKLSDPFHVEISESKLLKYKSTAVDKDFEYENFAQLKKVINPNNTIRGMELLPMETIFTESKKRTQIEGNFDKLGGVLKDLSGMKFKGYEIHMGETIVVGAGQVCALGSDCFHRVTKDGDGGNLGNIYGSYVHGIFDGEGIAETIVKALMKKKGMNDDEIDAVSTGMDLDTYKEKQYEKLARGMRNALDMEYIYEIMGIER